MHPYRRNADRDLRDLERAAAQGDLEAAKRLEHLHFRMGISLKNIDQDILLNRIDQWFGIMVEMEQYLSDKWDQSPYYLPTPAKKTVDRWKSQISQALSDDPVDYKLLAQVAYSLDRAEEELGDFLADDDFSVQELKDYAGYPLSLSSMWEDGAGCLIHHLRGLSRAYGPKGPNSIAWENVPRDNYSSQDELADNIVYISTGKPFSGRLQRRGPLFMVAISPRFRIEVRLNYAGHWKHSDEDDNLSLYEGSWESHQFDVRELLVNQWHVEVDRESESLIAWGELGERWQDATKLIGEWIDNWIINNLSWITCDECKKSKIHDDKNCRVCKEATVRYPLDDSFEEHLCHLCLYQSSGTQITHLCDACASICDKCGGVVCKSNYHTSKCNECGITLCDDIDCSTRCVGCDTSLCWDHRNDGKYGSLCNECYVEEQGQE